MPLIISNSQLSGFGEGSSENLVNCCNENVVLIYLQFFVKGNKEGDSFFAEAAQSRMQNIKAQNGYTEAKHKVHCPPIQDLGEISVIVPRYVDRYGGASVAFCKEIGVFSHAGWDGPMGSKDASVDPVGSHQMGISGWGAIRFNWWNTQTMFIAYGCNSGNEGYGDSFAKKISDLPNFAGVESWGQSTSSYPSFIPDYRATSVARNMNLAWSVRKTYQVGGNRGEGASATFTFGLNAPPATPMNCYKNGARTQQTHQGVYNDHRQNYSVLSI